MRLGFFGALVFFSEHKPASSELRNAWEKKQGESQSVVRGMSSSTFLTAFKNIITINNNNLYLINKYYLYILNDILLYVNLLLLIVINNYH